MFMRNYKQIQLENVCYVHGCRIEGLTLEKGLHNLSAWINYLFFLKEKENPHYWLDRIQHINWIYQVNIYFFY